MFAIKRNQVIITALVVMIAVAGYLNYIDRASLTPNEVVLTSEGEVSALVQEGILAEVSVDENPTLFGDVVENDMTEPGTAVFVNATTDSSYFIQAKLSREQARAKQKDLLLEVINNESIQQAQKAEAADAMLTIQQKIEKETATEAMIEAKGFKSVYVRIDESTVDIVVDKENLTEAETAQIEDIVKRKTGMSVEQIRISTMKRAS